MAEIHCTENQELLELRGGEQKAFGGARGWSRGEKIVGYARIDAKYYSELSQYVWHKSNNGYPCGFKVEGGRRVLAKLHQVVYLLEHGSLPLPPMEIDHINQDKLDNRVVNLRELDHHVSMANRGKFKNNTSGFIGVSIRQDHGGKCPHWVAIVRGVKLGKRGHLLQKRFPLTEQGWRDAAKAVNDCYKQHYPEVMVPNPDYLTRPYFVHEGDT